MSTDIATVIEAQIKENPVILYMKGNAEQPQCGFSQTVIKILNHLQVPFKAVNVLEDENIRQGIKEYSKWPTIPQLYVQQEFVGGCDIVMDLYKKGELTKLLKDFIPHETVG